jgi:hypothetical protein
MLDLGDWYRNSEDLAIDCKELSLRLEDRRMKNRKIEIKKDI